MHEIKAHEKEEKDRKKKKDLFLTEYMKLLGNNSWPFFSWLVEIKKHLHIFNSEGFTESDFSDSPRKWAKTVY